MSNSDILYYSLFCRFTKGIGNAKGIKLLSKESGHKELPLDDTTIHQNVKKELSLIEKLEIKIVTYFDEEYPAMLKEIYNPPLMLYYYGKLKQDFNLAIVGTRNPSQYGASVTRHIGEALLEEGVTLVSGFAHGVDSIVHSLALEKKAPTIAVLGCGLDINYPMAHQSMKSPIIENNGAIVSEFPLGTTPRPSNFPTRNRIISGLSSGVLVVEAGIKSGSLITAKIATEEQGRNVYTVPGNIFGDSFKGNHKLLKEGATLVETARDILKDYPVLNNLKRQQREMLTSDPIKIQTSIPEQLVAEKEKKEYKEFFNQESRPQGDFVENKTAHSPVSADKKTEIKPTFPDHKQEELIASLTGEESLIYFHLKEKVPIEVLVAKTNYSAPKTLSILTLLILKGLAVEEGGLYFSLS